MSSARLGDAWYGTPAAAFSARAGGVCAVPGLLAAGVAAGIKTDGALDVAVVDAGAVVDVAVVQTTNQVRAAPVDVTEEHAADGRARAVVLNAGNANACTGAAGSELARDMTVVASGALGCDAADVLVCSTGVIGVLPDRDVVLGGVDRAARAVVPTGGDDAARAIMTTDTVPKTVALDVGDDDGRCVVAGMAKGAGMLAPELATMLTVVATDAPVPARILSSITRQAVGRTFGRITVDGCRSTNDAVIVLATGTARRPPGVAAFTAALTAVFGELAEALVRDAEGAARLIRLHVRGAPHPDAALALGHAVADSVLVRTAFAGGDPNWGRILAAMGATTVPFDPRRVAVRFGSVLVCRFGVAASFDRGRAEAVLNQREIDVTIDLNLGPAAATVLTSDLTHDYVTINAEYTT